MSQRAGDTKRELRRLIAADPTRPLSDEGLGILIEMAYAEGGVDILTQMSTMTEKETCRWGSCDVQAAELVDYPAIAFVGHSTQRLAVCSGCAVLVRTEVAHLNATHDPDRCYICVRNVKVTK